jgi:AraC-like DNA-binding protein
VNPKQITQNRRSEAANSRGASVSYGFVKGLLASLDYRPALARELLELAGIATTNQNPNGRVPLTAYTALYRLTSERLNDEAFGLLSRPLRPGCFELLARNALSASQLGDAIERCANCLNALQDNLWLSLERGSTHGELRIEVRQPLPVGDAGFVFAHEWLLRLLHGLCAWLTAHPLPFDEVNFPYPPPAHAVDYELVFAPKVGFGGTTLVARLPPEFLSLPVRRDEAALREFLRAAPANITMLYRRERALAPRVRSVLRTNLRECPSLEDIARRLFISPRTLHRHLTAEGTSFRDVRDGLRHELAREWLTKTQRTVTQIASELGFADATAFYRAFAAWQGCGPREYRNVGRKVGAGGTAPAP